MTIKIDPEVAKTSCLAYRAAYGMTQRQLARKLLTTPGVIGDLERGRIRSQRVARAILAQAPEKVSAAD